MVEKILLSLLVLAINLATVSAIAPYMSFHARDLDETIVNSLSKQINNN